MENNYLISCYLILGIISSCQIGTYFAKFRFRQFSCGNETVRLKCDGQMTKIAIHQAFYTDEYAETVNFTCASDIASTETVNSTEKAEVDAEEAGPCYEDLRVFMNKGCSGETQCEYNYSNKEDRRCEALPNGLLMVIYDCVRESAFHKYCNSKLRLKEGYIASPGYPLFYPQLRNCNWTIEAVKGQKVVIQMLHVHMRHPTMKFDAESNPFRMNPVIDPQQSKCEQDYLQLMTEQKDKNTVTICGEEEDALQRVEFVVNKAVVVRFKTRDFFPASGFLLHYKVLGCRSLKPPLGGYLVSRNDSIAVYACDKGHVFNDSLENERFLQCVEDRGRWNVSLAPCVVAEDLHQAYTVLNRGIEKRTEIEARNETDSEKKTSVDASFLEDIIIPSALIAFLVLGNAIIIIVIFVIRRKHKSQVTEAESPPEIKKRDSLLEDYAEF